MRNNLRSFRVERGLSQPELGRRCGLTRQAISAIESGRHVPSTTASLRLASALGCRVEDLFQLDEEPRPCPVELVGEPDGESRRLAVVDVRGRRLAYPLARGLALSEGFTGANALLGGARRPMTADLLAPSGEVARTALLLGCDPALGLLASHVGQRRGERIVWLFTASRAALSAVARGEAHIAGSHLPGEENLSQAAHALSGAGGMLVAFARWELGLLAPPGNPKGIRTAADLARPDVSIVNREPGAGSRTVLDEALSRAGVPAVAVSGYERTASSHLDVARQVAAGAADAGVAPLSIARALGLDFVPLGEARFDLTIPADLAAHPAVAAVLDLLQTRPFREEVRAIAGYDVDEMGGVVATVPAG